MSRTNHKASSNASLNPRVSFCVATYKRPEFLQQTLVSILQQQGGSFEIIVSDNDPDKSARQTVKALKDERIRYVANINERHMMANFNNAFAHARGDFVCMIADDDPLMPGMLETTLKLVKAHPNFGMYFGACRVKSESGSLSFLNPDQQRDEVTIYTPQQFVQTFLRNRVFPYMLWSTGIVRKKILPSAAMPSYGSPFLTDYAFLLQAGLEAGCVTINRELGYQTAHAANYGRSELNILPQGCGQAYSFLKKLFTQHGHARQLLLLRSFLKDWVKRHILSVASFQQNHSGTLQYTRNDYQDFYIQTISALESSATFRDILELTMRLKIPYLGNLLYQILDGSFWFNVKRIIKYKIWSV